MWCFCVGLCVGKTALLILRRVGVCNLIFLSFRGVFFAKRLPLTIWGLAAGGASQQSFNASRAAKIAKYLSTRDNAPLAPNTPLAEGRAIHGFCPIRHFLSIFLFLSSAVSLSKNGRRVGKQIMAQPFFARGFIYDVRVANIELYKILIVNNIICTVYGGY